MGTEIEPAEITCVGTQKFLRFLRDNEQVLKPDLARSLLELWLPMRLKVRFENECWKHGQDPVQVVRQMIEYFVKEDNKFHVPHARTEEEAEEVEREYPGLQSAWAGIQAGRQAG